MTSHNASPNRSQDRIDTLIRWALRQEVRNTVPPSYVWGRIARRLTQQTDRRRGWWRTFQIAFRNTCLWLLDVSTPLPAEYAYCHSSGLSALGEKGYLCLLVYQCDLPMLLGQTV